jgi:hypothetical protein
MIDRYSNRKIFKNNLENYNFLIKNRGLKFISHYNSFKYSYKNEQNLGYITTYQHIWSLGDRYYKLSQKYYQNTNDWWLIALYNNKPTESDIILGETLFIPEKNQFLSLIEF